MQPSPLLLSKPDRDPNPEPKRYLATSIAQDRSSKRVPDTRLDATPLKLITQGKTCNMSTCRKHLGGNES
jgi:hypothetical protein